MRNYSVSTDGTFVETAFFEVTLNRIGQVEKARKKGFLRAGSVVRILTN